jgi:hypothetical protein
MIRTTQLGRLQKITFGELRSTGVRGVLVYCADYKCSHVVAMDTDTWPHSLRLSDIEGRFVCQVCGGRGAEVRHEGDRRQLMLRLV